jgi:hypothetical protein
MGIETNQATVALFDVANPARPARLSRIALGNGWSWSEGNSDEKAFKVLPQEGLVLVPFSSYGTNGSQTAVQLIDLSRDALRARGVIQQTFQPRRATVHRGRVVSISGWNLLSVDITDRDQPQIRADLPLTWTVDRVFLQGDYLLEISDNYSWGTRGVAVRVAPAARPDATLSLLSLTNLPITGAIARGGRLYLAQNMGDSYPIYLVRDTGANPSESHPPNFLLTVLDLSALPNMRVLGQTAVAVPSLGWSGEFQPVWLNERLLVWSGGESFYPWYWLTPMIAVDSLTVSRAAIWWPPWRAGGGQLLAFDVHDPSVPRLVSHVDLNTNGVGSSFSKPLVAENRVYLSSESNDYLPLDPKETNTAVLGTWVLRYNLHVIDYADAASPTVREPVSIPGQLRGLSRQGALLFTVGYRGNATNWTAPDGREWLAASAYDGVSAHLVDSMTLPERWPHPVLAQDDHIFVGQPGDEKSSHSLVNWTFPDTGRFTQVGRLILAQPAEELASFPGMLAVRESDRRIVLLDRADPARLRPVGEQQFGTCLWFDLTRSDGAVDRGLWIPLGAYGVARVEVTSQ